MINRRRRNSLLLSAVVLCLGMLSYTLKTEKKQQPYLTLFVASSLTDVMTEITDQYTKETGTVIKMSMASSGTLAKQLSQGAVADLYFSASQKWMDYSEAENLIVKSTRMIPANNTLVLVSPKVVKSTSLSCLSDLKSETIERISIGDPAHVPAGKYAVSALKSLDLYSDVETKLLPGKDVRSALMVVELGECDYGIVYKTDALKSDKVTIEKAFPETSHEPVAYAGAVCKATGNTQESKALLEYIAGESAKKIWTKYGFEIGVHSETLLRWNTTLVNHLNKDGVTNSLER